MEMNRDWLARYRVGQREQVWHELRQLGAAVREPEIRAEAQLVCDEMAVRARHNIEVIVERLTQEVPLTLLSWVRLVGDVWLVGTHPEWPTSASADPLVIQVEGSHHPEWPIQDYFTDK